MTDIVERLRALQQLAENDQPFGYVKDIFRCAADEIGRLREVLKRAMDASDDGWLDEARRALEPSQFLPPD